MNQIAQQLRYKLPFLIAGFASMMLSVYLYFVADETTAAIFVGLWVPSIHSLGALMLSSDDHVSDVATISCRRHEGVTS